MDCGNLHFLTPMDYSPWSEREILAVSMVALTKGAIISETEEMSCPPKLVCMHFTSTSTCMNFLSRFHFLTPMDYSPWSEGKFWPLLKVQVKGAISLKPDKTTAHQNWFACILISTSTCMNFLSRFHFLTPMDYSPWSEGKFWPFLRSMKKEKI